ncbi:MAG TPA: hypothetical protein VG317_11250 [Pseudonocardiaceae bacterium]|jgi:hypothetical protein|nr:hypothetical protein [Pseudonocardiaceae bacterium]
MARLLDDTLFGPDGTQSLAPPPVLPDPLAGLVTGVSLAGADTFFGEPGALAVVPPSAPPPPDTAAVREAVAAVFADDRPRRRAQNPPRTRQVNQPAYQRVQPAYQPRASGSPVAVPYGTAVGTAPRPATAPVRRRRGGGFVGILLLLIVLGLARYGGALIDLISRLLHR